MPHAKSVRPPVMSSCPSLHLQVRTEMICQGIEQAENAEKRQDMFLLFHINSRGVSDCKAASPRDHCHQVSHYTSDATGGYFKRR